MTHARTTHRRAGRAVCRAVAAAAATGLLATGLAATTSSASPLATPAEPGSAAFVGAEPSAAADVAHGDVILNLFQWTWTSVAEECTSTIGPAGIDAVQVSPPQEHIQGAEWWTSYQPVSYKIESKLGTREEFKAMVDACGEAGVGVVADAVINHTTGADQGAGTGVAGTSFAVDDFPGVPYGPGDFNDCRENIANYGDRDEVQNCRLVSLQDLRTGSPDVQDKIAGYLNDLIDLGVQGFRIDAAKHMPAEDLAAIKGKLSDPGIYWVQEVIGAGGEPIRPSEYVGNGDVHEFDYARQLKSAFGGQLASLQGIADGKLPSDQAGVFVTNHDTERNGETLTSKDGDAYRLASLFMLAFPYGSPSLYSGYTFDDKDAGAPGATATGVDDADCDSGAWSCIQRDPAVAGMVRFHHAVEGTELTDWWDDGGNQIAFGRGDAGFVALNAGDGEAEHTFQTSLPAGEYANVAAGDDVAETYTVAADGTFTATVPAHGAVALLPAGADG
ncbi:alpha-amylase family protein [Isoptericola sp. NPDC057391]|uniref:alpha-amylase n=1 Tax=Isoptericola sp. NPDC057391 TaxID=3346117 RepID=UPI00362FE25E